MIRSLVERMRDAGHLILLLDYDGTLVPIVPRPELAAADEDVRALLRALVARPETTVHVVSGRRQEDLDRWVGDTGVSLVAEHGVWARAPGTTWRRLVEADLSWMEAARPALRALVEEHRGSVLEEKSSSFSWHFRAAPSVDDARAHAVAEDLRARLAAGSVDVFVGDKIVEVRVHGATKARAVEHARRTGPRGALMVACGDDRTDEDMFDALDESGAAVHVGTEKPTRAQFKVPDVAALRAVLRALLES